MIRKKLQILLAATLFLSFIGGSTLSIAQERKLSRIERRADRNFIRQKFDKAMGQYETAIKRETDKNYRAALHLKAARCTLWYATMFLRSGIMPKQWSFGAICCW